MNPFLIRRLLLSFLAVTALGIRAQTNPADAKSGPRIRFESNLYEFGKIPTGDAVKHDFIFTNAGNATLEITDVHPGCGCTTAGAWDRLVEPGKTGRIPLQFNSAGFSGMVEKSATVTCNDSQNPSIILQLKGTIWTPIQVTPSIAVFNVRSDATNVETRKLRIENNTEAPLSLSDLQCSNSQISLSLNPIEAGKAFEIDITARPPFQPGTQIIPITAKTSLKETPILSMSAYLIVQPPIAVSPPQLLLPDQSPASGTTNVFYVRNQTAKRLQLSKAASTIPGARVEIVETEPGQLASLNVVLPAKLQIKAGEHYEITADTGIDSMPTLVIPVIQNMAATATSSAPQSVVPHTRAIRTRSTLAAPAGK